MLHTRLSFVSSAAFVLASVIALTAADSAVAAPRQAPGGASQESAPAVQLERDKDYGTAVACEKDAGEEAQRYVDSRGWTDKDGINCFIGVSAIEALGPSKFDVQRRAAFRRAMVDAKRQLVEFLSQSVETSFRDRWESGNPPIDSITNPKPIADSNPSALEKLGAILDYEINQELKKRDIDPSLKTPEDRAKLEAAAREAARVVQSRSTFQSAIRSAAEAEVSGLQAFRTFECVSKDGGGTIAVVATHSAKTEGLQRALLGLAPAPRDQPPQESIESWLQNLSESALLCTYGAQLRRNEIGEWVLLAFGQSNPVGKGREQLQQAGRDAEESAKEVLRNYMGELIRSDAYTQEATSLATFADETSEFEDQKRVEREVQGIAKSLEMPGMKVVHRWQSTHPRSDRPTKGAVVLWSVSNAEAAKALRARIEAAGGASGGRGIAGSSKPNSGAPKAGQPRPDGQEFNGQGVEGETP
ncbi:MAG: hypothetical protein QM516_02730 [Limnohabitans sp.]|nr:hypothetical protein [Limnohabitans sp.]